MNCLICETLDFTDVLSDYFEDDEAFLRLQNFLIQNPTVGPVIPKSGSLRKVRWVDPKRRKGKRSGLRVIYLYLPEFERLLLIDIYDKNEQENLSNEDLKAFREFIEEYRLELKNKKRGRS